MNHSNKITSVAGSLLLSLILANQAAHADSVEFIASVPNGTTTSYGLILFSVADGDDPGLSYEDDTSPGMTGNNIVTSMDIEMDLTPGFDGIVSGNTLSVEEVCEAAFIAPAEVAMSMNLDPSYCNGVLPPQPVFPLVAEKRRDTWATILLLGHPKKQQAERARSAGRLAVRLIWLTEEVYVEVAFDENETTSDIARRLDEAFRRADCPSDVTYVGLDPDGYPTFESSEGLRSARFEVNVKSAPGFHVGAAVLLPTEPSPNTF